MVDLTVCTASKGVIIVLSGLNRIMYGLSRSLLKSKRQYALLDQGWQHLHEPRLTSDIIDIELYIANHSSHFGVVSSFDQIL